MRLRSTTAVLKSMRCIEPPKVLLITDEGGGIARSWNEAISRGNEEDRLKKVAGKLIPSLVNLASL